MGASPFVLDTVAAILAQETRSAGDGSDVGDLRPQYVMEIEPKAL
jgi:hypothetical protein